MNSRFFYHAFGVGLGGRITRPCCELIQTQATTALASVGGYASTHVDAYSFRDIVSIRSASAYVFGSQADDGSFNTSVTVTVEGLNILDVITAESITARLASRHRLSGDPPKAGEPVLTTIGTEFRNLQIRGCSFNIQTDNELFCKETAYPAFRDAGLKQAGQEPWLPSADGSMVMGSLVTPYSISVPSVGTVFLGEILASRYARRLTMIRVKMGSPVAGDVEVASGEVDGSSFP